MKPDRTRSDRIYEGWVDSVGRHPILTLFLSFFATAGLLAYSISHFRIDTDFSDMISDKLAYRKVEKDFQKAFPQLGNTVVVVIDAETPEAASLFQKRIAERLKKETSLFERVSLPGSGEFFEKNGLLYLSRQKLEELSDNLAGAQPLLGLLSSDFSLRGLFFVIERMLGEETSPEQRQRLLPLFDRLGKALQSTQSNRPFQLSWQELILGSEAARELRRQFLIIEPAGVGGPSSKESEAIETLRRLRDELKLHGTGGVTMRLTGELVLNDENILVMKTGMGITTLVSFILVAVALAVGFGSGRLVFACLLTLLTGLVWTFGFAILFIGRLNLISVAFAVLFIGLGIDYGIQYCLRYREERVSGFAHREALVRTARRSGPSLKLCTVAAAIGFYSFLPTAYTGVSELGLIAGTGMFINLLATLTLLPALLTVMPPRGRGLKEFSSARWLYLFPSRHGKAIRIGAVIAGVAALPFLTKLSFNYNPLDLYDQRSEAISTMKELFQGGRTSPWTISFLAKNESEAEEIKSRLKGLKEVQQAVSLADFVPDDQPEKLTILSDIALFMPPGFETIMPQTLSPGKKIEAFKQLRKVLGDFVSRGSGEGAEIFASVEKLHRAAQDFEKVLDDPEKGRQAMDRLQNSLLSNLPALFEHLKTSLQARPVMESDLPQEIVDQYLSRDGRYRVEVFPSENILNVDALQRFVRRVSALAPEATDTPVTIFQAGKAVVQSFLEATLYALLAITVYLLIDLRSISDTALVLLPLALSLLLTGAASVIFGLPFNFANVIVIPLLIGSGVEGIYMIYRFRKEPPPDGNILNTSTARALFFSAFTTILSFSALSFSSHRGTASMGVLLTICMGSLMVTTLLLLPAMLSWMSRKGRPKD